MSENASSPQTDNNHQIVDFGDLLDVIKDLKLNKIPPEMRGPEDYYQIGMLRYNTVNDLYMIRADAFSEKGPSVVRLVHAAEIEFPELQHRISPVLRQKLEELYQDLDKKELLADNALLQQTVNMSSRVRRFMAAAAIFGAGMFVQKSCPDFSCTVWGKKDKAQAVLPTGAISKIANSPSLDKKDLPDPTP